MKEIGSWCGAASAALVGIGVLIGVGKLLNTIRLEHAFGVALAFVALGLMTFAVGVAFWRYDEVQAERKKAREALKERFDR